MSLSLGPVLRRGRAEVRIGTCSWTDATLVKETDWYPRKSMKAAERLAYYAERFPIVEVDSTYYFPPTPELGASWVERTPDDFVMNVKAWSLLTGHPTFPHSLWEDLQPAVLPEFKDKRNLYLKHLPAEVVDESWDRFRHALLPLHSSGKLGAVLFQYPEWFGPKAANRAAVLEAQDRLGDLRICVEFRNARWLAPDECEATLSFLEDNDLAFVCVDEPQGFRSSMPPVVAATSELAVVRFHGRNADTWEKKGISAAERFAYDYTTAELEAWGPKIDELAASAGELQLLFNNCYRDYAVNNAAELMRQLAE